MTAIDYPRLTIHGLDDGAVLGLSLHREPRGTADIQLADIFVFEERAYRFTLEVEDVREVASAWLVVDKAGRMGLDARPGVSRPGQGRPPLVLTSRSLQGPQGALPPFHQSSGISRIRVHLALTDGSSADFLSDDLLVVPDAEDSAEDARERDMLAQLLETDGNQAAEWMFGREPKPGEAPLSADTSTDWAAPSLLRFLETARELAAAGKATEAIADNVGNLREQIERELLSARSLKARIIRLAERAGRPETSLSTIPALGALAEAVEREEGYLERITQVEDLIDVHGVEPDEGTGAPSAGTATLSPATFSREQRTLHAVRPNVLFELYGLWRILDELWRRGFHEDADGDSHALPAIDHFIYRHAAPVDPNEGDASCANTYRLRDAAGTRVTLWYQPVIYGDATEENGIGLHRIVDTGRFREAPLPPGNEPPVPVYTPDYMLEVRRRDGSRLIIPMDAKNVPIERASGLTMNNGSESQLEQVQRKYLAECVDALDGGRASAVWVVCGKGDESFLPVRPSSWALEHGVVPSGAVRLSPDTSPGIVREFLGLFLD